MRFGGFIKQSLVDYPGNIASVVFTNGCNFRCPYCHNAGLVLPHLSNKNGYTTDYIFNYLIENRKLLDAVVITGGEPTIHDELDGFIEEIKLLNLKVKLDTNGTNPSFIRKLVEKNMIDAIAMDVKTELEFEKYNIVSGNVLTKENYLDILESIHFIKYSGIDYEFRTTFLEEYHNNTISKIRTQLGDVKRYKVNQFKASANLLKDYLSKKV